MKIRWIGKFSLKSEFGPGGLFHIGRFEVGLLLAIALIVLAIVMVGTVS